MLDDITKDQGYIPFNKLQRIYLFVTQSEFYLFSFSVLTKVMSGLRPKAPLPSGTKPMEDQVAGHKYSDGKLGKPPPPPSRLNFPFPSGTKPMEDQVAGHKYSDGKLGKPPPPPLPG